MEITSDLKVKAGKSGKTTVTIKAGEKIKDIYSFAGKGSKNNLVVSGTLKRQYGTSNSEGWAHLAGTSNVIDSNGNERVAEIHWFEHEELGQTGFKVKKGR